MVNTKNRPNRNDVSDEQKWDLSAIFQSRDHWEKELTAVQEATATVTKFRGNLDENAKTLLDDNPPANWKA